MLYKFSRKIDISLYVVLQLSKKSELFLEKIAFPFQKKTKIMFLAS